MEFSLEVRQEMLKKLSFKAKKTPSTKTCKSKLAFAAGVLNIISKNITEESAMFAHCIVDTIQVYLENVESVALDKFILKISNKVFIPELFKQVKNLDDPEVMAAVCYVKYKKLSTFDSRILQVYPKLRGEIKMKIDKAFGYTILQDPTCLNGSSKSVELEDAFNPERLIGDTKQIDQRREYYSTEHVQSPAGIFKELVSKDRVWNDFSKFYLSEQVFKDTKVFKEIISIIKHIENDRIKEAKIKLINAIGSFPDANKIVVYSLLSYVHLLSLEFHESMYYLDLSLSSSVGFDYEFLLNCKFLMERMASIHSISPHLDIHLETSIEVSDYQAHFQNKLLMRSLLGTSFERISLYSKAYASKPQLQYILNKIRSKLNGASLLYIFTVEGRLYINDTQVVHSFDIDWNEVTSTFSRIMLENRDVLAMDVVTAEDKKLWWSIRIGLDKELESLVSQLRPKISIHVEDSIVFILDESIVDFPFEAIFGKPSFRILSQDIFNDVPTNRIKSLFYLLDPANNLPSTREAIVEFISKKRTDQLYDKLYGVVGRPLSNQECDGLSTKDLFVYFGHGTGKKYFEIQDANPKVLFLFGCSSCRLIATKNFRCNGFTMQHMRKRRVILGNLWDVTDKDLDKLTIAILEDFFQGLSLIESIQKNRDVCRLKYLNSAALVVYGTFDSIQFEPSSVV